MVVVLYAQNNVKGVVTGNGEPLSGASVLVLNSYYGISTESDGSFELKNLNRNQITLKVSFIGFETKEVVLNAQSKDKININLEQSSIYTDEIQITTTRAGNNTPVAYTNISKEYIEDHR